MDCLVDSELQSRPLDEFARGYFCAVSTILQTHGDFGGIAEKVFRMGGNPADADPEDREVFRQHGLMP